MVMGWLWMGDRFYGDTTVLCVKGPVDRSIPDLPQGRRQTLPNSCVLLAVDERLHKIEATKGASINKRTNEVHPAKRVTER
jgi:hypothetical protein